MKRTQQSRYEAASHEHPSLEIVRGTGALGALGAAILLEYALEWSSVAAFALGVTAFAISLVALRWPHLLFSPAAKVDAVARRYEDARTRVASND